LAIIKSKSARLLDKTRKELHKMFEQFDLKITAEVNLNVACKFFRCYFRPEQRKTQTIHAGNPMTIHCTSTDIQTIHQTLQDNYLRLSCNKRIALLSSDEQTFKESTPIYLNALRHSNFDHEFTYTQNASQRTCRYRQRNIIWFNPPFSKSANRTGILKFN
jgi:hypothetical protein